jgi:predicted Zn-dependent protease
MQFGRRSVISVSVTTVVVFLTVLALGASVTHAELFGIVRDSSVNVFAAPGGFIFVNRGLVSFVKSNDELAFVLGMRQPTSRIAMRLSWPNAKWSSGYE